MSRSAGAMSPPREAIQVALHGLAVRIVCPEPSIAATLESRFANFSSAARPEADITVVCNLDLAPHKPPADGRVVYESPFATAVYSPGEDTLYAFHADGATMRCDPAARRAEISVSSSGEGRDWVVTRPLLTLALMELVRRRGFFPLHAACLARDGAGVLVCGPSGSGKSTLTIALLEAGLDFLGDDLVFLEPRGRTVRALGFPDELGISADAAEHLPRLLAHVDTSPPPGWPKARADVRVIAPGATVVDACEPRLVLLLSDQVEPGVVEETGTDDALLELVPNILLTEAATCTAHLQALATLTRSAPIFRTAPRPDLAALCKVVADTLGT
jgi:hypothetical protein